MYYCSKSKAFFSDEPNYRRHADTKWKALKPAQELHIEVDIVLTVSEASFGTLTIDQCCMRRAQHLHKWLTKVGWRRVLHGEGHRQEIGSNRFGRGRRMGNRDVCLAIASERSQSVNVLCTALLRKHRGGPTSPLSFSTWGFWFCQERLNRRVARRVRYNDGFVKNVKRAFP